MCMDPEYPEPDEMDDGHIDEVQLQPHVRYSLLLTSHFSRIAPRLVHAQGSPLKAATFALPEYDLDSQRLKFEMFHQAGFCVVPGMSPKFPWQVHGKIMQFQAHIFLSTHTQINYDLFLLALANCFVTMRVTIRSHLVCRTIRTGPNQAFLLMLQ